jgi:hypothetical protein
MNKQHPNTSFKGLTLLKNLKRCIVCDGEINKNGMLYHSATSGTVCMIHVEYCAETFAGSKLLNQLKN